MWWIEGLFLWHGCGCVRVAQIAEHTQLGIGRMRVVEEKVWGGEVEGLGGSSVEEICGGMESFSPIPRR